MITQTLATSPSIEPKGATFGIRLKSAREALGMERKDVASALRLHEKIILMIETGEYKTDIPMTFIRGYIRNYSKLMGIPEQELLEVMEAMKPKPVVTEEEASSAQHITASDLGATEKYMPANFGSSFMRLFTGLLAVTLIGLVTVWWHNYKSTSHNSTSQDQTAIIEKMSETQATNTVSEPSTVKSPVASKTVNETGLTAFYSYINMMNGPTQFFMDFTLFLIILAASMRLYATPVMAAGIRSTRMKRYVQPGFDWNKFLKISVRPSMAKFAIAVVVIAGVSSLLWSHHTHKQVTVVARTPNQPVITEAKPAPVANLNDLALMTALEALLPTTTLNSVILSSYQPYALQAMQLTLDEYIAFAAAAKFTLTDPSMPAWEFRKKGRRHRPAYYTNESGNSNPPPYYQQQYYQ